MGIHVKKLLDKYFYKEEIQDALEDIGEPVSGSKDELIRRLLNNWESHNRDIYQLLDFIEDKSLNEICTDFDLGILPARAETLRKRIKKADLFGHGSKKPTAHADTSHDSLAPKNKPKMDTSHDSMIPKNKQKITDEKSPKITAYIKNHLVQFVLSIVAGVIVLVVGIFLK